MSVFIDQPAKDTARLLSAAAGDNSAVAVARPCALKGIQGHNAATTARFLKLYDQKAAPASSDTPVKTIYLPAETTFALDFVAGYEFENGLGYRLTTGSADNDTGALIAGDILSLNIDYR